MSKGLTMKKIIASLLFVCALFSSAYATSYIIVEEGMSLLVGKTKIYNGTPVEVKSQSSKNATVIIKGFINPLDAKSLYATKNLKLLLAQVNDDSMIQKAGDQGTLEIEIEAKYLVENADLAWEKSTDRFYEKCTKCHAAKVVKDHTMLEWEGLYESMKEFAKPTDDDTSHILRFLKAYAKDGILSE